MIYVIIVSYAQAWQLFNKSRTSQNFKTSCILSNWNNNKHFVLRLQCPKQAWYVRRYENLQSKDLLNIKPFIINRKHINPLNKYCIILWGKSVKLHHRYSLFCNQCEKYFHFDALIEWFLKNWKKSWCSIISSSGKLW